MDDEEDEWKEIKEMHEQRKKYLSGGINRREEYVRGNGGRGAEEERGGP